MAAMGAFSLLIVSFVWMKYSNAQLEWKPSDTMQSDIEKASFDSSTPETMCAIFRSPNFTSKAKKSEMKPSLAKKLLQKIKECYRGELELEDDVTQLGPLTCYYDNAPDLTPELSRQLLAQFSECKNPKATMLKMLLLRKALSNSNWTTYEVLHLLGSSVSLLSPTQLDSIASADLKQVIKDLPPGVQWRMTQQRTLVKKLLGDDECQEVSSQQLLQLGQVIKGVPSCVLRRVKTLEMLKDVETLRSVSERMRRAQRKAMLQGLLKKMSPLELVGRLPGSLLRSLSVKTLQEADITSSLQLKAESLNRPQAAFLAAKLFKRHTSHFWRTSIIQGVTCKMIDKMADTDLQDMAQAIEETPWWLSKAQIGCAAWKYFAALRKARADCFKNITEEQLIEIPTSLMIHLPAWELNHLPDSVCEVFLNKTQSAKLSSLPRPSTSRLALLHKALHCLTKDKNMSSLLTVEDVSRLGELVCELPASTLSLMDANTLNVSMQVIASCQHVPHREALMQLIKENFRNPSEWSQETMESLGPLWDWDENALFALPFKPWMIEVFYFLRSQHRTQALRRTFFKLITSKREDEVMTDSLNSNEPTVDLIEELGMDNVFWSADQLDAMSSDMFLVTMETLGSVPDYDLEQLTVLSKKATEALGEASHMNESVVAQIGCIAQGFSNADLEKMAFSLDMLEETGRCGWKMWQLNSVWKSVSKRNNLSAEQLDASDMAALNVFMCGLSSDEISQLDVAAFRDAVGTINDIRCSPSVAQQFQKVLLSAFGRPDSWTEASVSEVGTMIAGLHAHQLVSLDPSVMMFLSQSSVPLLHPNNIAALSVAQLEALGPDNAAMVTRGQRAALTDVQMDALARAESGEMQSAASQMQSGAPSVNTEGISALIKPLLVLLVGLLLL
ncbi:otoancorin-like [Entelurus aequoreus]|uniref:otoancorin-like n=1 Tax=Entelurus aequoreus TaxID=161455 RepID=UPI002B1E50D9|nr:otoancorin-like [Entelurus aequoreus]